MPGKTTRPKKD